MIEFSTVFRSDKSKVYRRSEDKTCRSPLRVQRDRRDVVEARAPHLEHKIRGRSMPFSNLSSPNTINMEEKEDNHVSIHHVDSTNRKIVLASDVQSKQVFSPMLILALIAFQATSILYGYDDKVISPVAAMEQFVEKFQGPNPVTGKFVLTARNQTLVFSVPLVGAIVGAATSGFLTTKFGRKWPIVGSYVCSYGGTFLQTFAPNFAAFVCGRFINAFLISIGTTISILYLSEVVPARYRGPAVSASNIFNLISGVIATVICNRTHTMGGQASFKIPLGAQAILPTILIPLTSFIPESPLWLLMNDRAEEAKINLRKLRGFDDSLVEDELRVMKQAHDSEVALTAGVTFFDLFKMKNLKRTLVAGSMYSVNQCSGVILSTTYATIFLTNLGVGSPFQLTIAASCCTLAGTLIAPFVIENLGRRPVAMIGMSILLVIDIIAGALAFYVDRKHIPIAIAVLSFLFNVFWAASFYPLSVVLPTEVPEPRLRSITTSYTLACAYTTAVITTFAVPQLVSPDAANLGSKTYLIFGGCVLIILVLYSIYLPETAGRTFAEIQEMYEAKVPVTKWKKYQTSAESKEAKVVDKQALTHA